MRTKWILSAVAMVAAMMPLAPAHGLDSSTRVETVTYELGQNPLVGVHGNFGAVVMQLDLPAGPENFLDISIEDDTGQSVAAEIAQDDPVADICGKSETPLKIRPNFPVRVTLFIGRCPDGTPATVTKGTVTAKFLSRSPVSKVQVRSYAPHEDKMGNRDEGVTLTSKMFPAEMGRHISVEINDQSGQAISGIVYQDENPIGAICGKTATPIRIDRRVPVEVRIFIGPCGQSGVSTPTRGTIRVEYSR